MKKQDTYYEIVEIHTYLGSKLIQKEEDFCGEIDAEAVKPLVSWDWCDVKPARGHRAEIHWRIEKDGETIYSAQTTAEGEPQMIVDKDALIDTLESIYPPVEITDDLIFRTTAWLEGIAADWDGSDIEGKTGGQVDRTAQGYIIDWSRALVEVEND